MLSVSVMFLACCCYARLIKPIKGCFTTRTQGCVVMCLTIRMMNGEEQEREKQKAVYLLHPLRMWAEEEEEEAGYYCVPVGNTVAGLLVGVSLVIGVVAHPKKGSSFSIKDARSGKLGAFVFLSLGILLAAKVTGAGSCRRSG